MLIKVTAIVKFSGIYKWDIINPLKDCLKSGAYGKGRIYLLEYTKLADSERGRL